MITKKPGLAEIMGTMHDLLRGSTTPEEAAVALGASAERLRLYQGMVKNHTRVLLEKTYTALPGLLGSEVWGSLVDDYFREHPAGHYELNANGAMFRDFLEGRRLEGDAGLTGFHVDLAELEWREWEVYSSEAVNPPRDTMDGPILNPTLLVLSLDWPAADWLESWRRAEADGDVPPPIPTESAPETVLVFRHPETFRAVFYKGTDDLLFPVKMIHEGIDVGEAARLSGLQEETVEEFVAYAAEIGLVIVPGRKAPTDVAERITAI